MALHIYGPAFSTLVRSVRLYCLEKGLAVGSGMSVDGRPVPLRSTEHFTLHPFGQVPVLLHDGNSVFETLAICRYLDRAFPDSSLEPEDTASRTLVDQWASALITTVDTRLIRSYLLQVAGPRVTEPLVGPALAQAEQAVDRTLAVLEGELGERDFLCGVRYSLGDALLIPMLDYLTRMPGREWLAGRPGLAAYLQSMRQRPSGHEVLVAPDFSELQPAS
ncbi:MAG TPA: glutathione S-transferase family protein [Pseudomonas sp.]